MIRVSYTSIYESCLLHVHIWVMSLIHLYMSPVSYIWVMSLIHLYMSHLLYIYIWVKSLIHIYMSRVSYTSIYESCLLYIYIWVMSLSLALPDSAGSTPEGFCLLQVCAPGLVRLQRVLFLQVWVRFPPLVQFQCVITQKLGHDCDVSMREPNQMFSAWFLPIIAEAALGKTSHTHS